MRSIVVILLCGLVAGCVSDLAVRMQPHELQNGNLLAQVKVNDLRAPGIAASKREAAFGVPMGNITFDPPEAQQVKNLLEVELTRLLRERGIQSQRDYVCDLVEFGVNTDTTPLYWDVIGWVRLVLKHSGREYNLLGTHTERTVVWPSESVIAKVVDESLKQIAADLKQSAEGL